MTAKTMSHNDLAVYLFGELTSETRAKAKAINFGRMYSMGEVKISQISGVYPTK